MSLYYQEFLLAIERTKNFKLSIPEINIKPQKRLLSNEVINQLPEVIFQNFGYLTPEQLINNCIEIHFNLRQVIENFLRAKTYYTIGYITINNVSIFKINEEDIKSYLQNKITKPVNFHSWLTLESLEIIDLTLPTTIAVIKNLPQKTGGIIAKHPNELSGNLVYHPMLVGTDFLLKIKAFTGFSIFSPQEMP
ncbi:MAG: hypothetical protein QXY47_07500 [Thermoplasmata archaeon]